MSINEYYEPRQRNPLPNEILEKVKIPPLRINYREEPFFRRVHLNDLYFGVEDDTTYNISQKISAQVMDMTDKVLMKSIISAAREEGVNDLFLIDKEFIITAIKNEIARRQREVTNENTSGI